MKTIVYTCYNDTVLLKKKIYEGYQYTIGQKIQNAIYIEQPYQIKIKVHKQVSLSCK